MTLIPHPRIADPKVEEEPTGRCYSWNLVPWKCSICDLTNFGGNRWCADWRCKNPRPADFVEREKPSV